MSGRPNGNRAVLGAHPPHPSGVRPHPVPSQALTALGALSQALTALGALSQALSGLGALSQALSGLGALLPEGEGTRTGRQHPSPNTRHPPVNGRDHRPIAPPSRPAPPG